MRCHPISCILSHQAALYMHKPAPALHDVGFDLIPVRSFIRPH